MQVVTLPVPWPIRSWMEQFGIRQGEEALLEASRRQGKAGCGASLLPSSRKADSFVLFD